MHMTLALDGAIAFRQGSQPKVLQFANLVGHCS